MLSTIALTVNGQTLTGNSIQIASSLVEEITCTFTFEGTDWSGFTEIRAIFQNRQSGIKIEKTLSNNSTTVPHEVLMKKGEVVVNLCAYTENASTHVMTLRMTSYQTKIIDVKQKVNTYGDNMLPPSRQYWQEELDAEISARQTADTALQTNIDAEATTRASADTTLQANITAEATTRASADATLQTNIDTEAITRANADSTLQTNITNEANTRQNADTTLQTNINNEATSRENADNALSNRITTIEGYETYWNSKVDSVNGKSGTVVLDADDVGAVPNTTLIPTKVSDLSNDLHFIPDAPSDNKEYARKNGGWSEVEGRSSDVTSVNGKTGAVVLDADDVGALADDTTLADLPTDTTHRVVTDTQINSWNNKLSEDDVVDSVTSTSAVDPLSANQGKLLNDRINNLEAIGRYLAIWNCTTGLPTTNPSSLPYTYKTGDYYRIGTVNSGNTTHSISISGTSVGAIYDGTYSVSFTLENSTSTAYTTIGAIADAIGDDVQITAIGTMHTTTAGDLDIVKVIKWTDVDGNSVIAMLGEDLQKGMMTGTTSDTLTDIVSGGVNYKPNGSSYTGVASSTVATETEIATGDLWVYDGTNWNLSINHIGAFVEDVKVNGTSVVSSGTANVTVPTALSDLTEDTTHRVVTDSQIGGWNGKQDALPTVTNNRYLHTNASTGALEWSNVTDSFIATYNETSVADVKAALQAGKAVFCKYEDDDIYSIYPIASYEFGDMYSFGVTVMGEESGEDIYITVSVVLTESTNTWSRTQTVGTIPELPATVNNRYLHTNSSTGALEWSTVEEPKSFIATYGTTTASEIATAVSAGKAIFVNYTDGGVTNQLMLVDNSDSKYGFAKATVGTSGDITSVAGMTITLAKATNTWEVFSGSDSIPTKTSDLTNDGDGTNAFLTEHQSLSAYRTSSAQDTIDSGKESSSNKTTSLSSSSTDTQYPSAKCVYEALDKEYELIETITLTEDVTDITRTQEPDGTAYNFEAMWVNLDAAIGTGGNKYFRFYSGTAFSETMHGWYTSTSEQRFTDCYIDLTKGLGACLWCNGSYDMYRNISGLGNMIVADSIDKFVFDGALATGTVLKIYGVRA